MSDRRVLSAPELQELAGVLARLGSFLRNVTAEELAARLGWQVVERRDDVVIVDTGLPVDDGRADLRIDGGPVSDVSVTISDVEPDETEEARAFRTDAFAEAVEALRGVYGEPTAAEPGDYPEASWRLAEVTLRVWLGAAVDLQVMLNADADALDEEY
jgi:hypothetical protein